jgi:hypothetical protein
MPRSSHPIPLKFVGFWEPTSPLDYLLNFPITNRNNTASIYYSNHEDSRPIRLRLRSLCYISSISLRQSRRKEAAIHAKIEASPTSLLVETR